ncbi:helix-turn-helix domain-containing protein [Nannocystaceae bacterium ST9]
MCYQYPGLPHARKPIDRRALEKAEIVVSARGRIETRPHGRLCGRRLCWESRGMTSDDRLATLLLAALARHELTQAEVARRTGIRAPKLNRIVHGKGRPNAMELGALAHVLEIDLVELLGVVDEVSRISSERDELARRLAELTLAAEQLERLLTQKIEAGDRVRARLIEKADDLEERLDQVGRARSLADAEVKRLRAELAKANDRIELLQEINGFSRPQSNSPPPVDVPTWSSNPLMSMESSKIEQELAQARLLGRVVGAGVEIVALLWHRQKSTG